MGKVSKRTDRAGKETWLVRWRDPDGVQKKKTYTKKKEADRELTRIEGSILDGTYVDPKASKITVGEWADRWLTTQAHIKASTRADYETVVKTHIKERWGGRPLAKLNHADIAQWVSELSAGGLSPSRVRLIHGTLLRILALAVKDRRLAYNSAEGVSLPRVLVPEKRYLTHEQVAALAGAATPYGPMVNVLAYCGLRFGELAGLRVKRVDTMNRRLTIAETVTEVKGHLVWSGTKGHLTRSVPFPRFLTDDLTAACAGKGPEDLVFTSPRGETLRNGNWRDYCFDKAAAAAKLACPIRCQQQHTHQILTPHELRHTAASLAISDGASAKSVQRMLGHKSAAMTQDVYTGLFEDDLDAVAERMDSGAEAARKSRGVPPTRPEASVTEIDSRRKTS